MNAESHYRAIVERAGATFVDIRNGSVRFKDGPSGGEVISLYVFSLRSVKDVLLALKARREKLSVDVWSNL
jgi:hypothetical protein